MSVEEPSIHCSNPFHSLSYSSHYTPQVPTHNDPIISQLLSHREQMTDVSDADEQERQRRMYTMLRHSRKYKKIQVELANGRWESSNQESAQVSIEGNEITAALLQLGDLEGSARAAFPPPSLLESTNPSGRERQASGNSGGSKAGSRWVSFSETVVVIRQPPGRIATKLNESDESLAESPRDSQSTETSVVSISSDASSNSEISPASNASSNSDSEKVIEPASGIAGKLDNDLSKHPASHAVPAIRSGRRKKLRFKAIATKLLGRKRT
ncbi:uncharacterized protein SPPG_02550 [Spizellomyces punctatus DAOM BR117]|uniref:Uncharacterized protein n=1 Tax=Spizellomyces punctatus (strain DAOM BR117) TaxID=645134 RepID=A0A0L0HKQ2_SPIPD|nr:uncharacterized protein SPPG_02550 [Spizellomyces punctatus DAOM BR117]KND02046.1 hypothetical protein SPPG_02550 [Spizellomyces punctatus DAOM BR117]|eukprot:XP_016610085.1 hypothetical protein SPPG_02550 [Spizellomyces punctatus DAOM BR117]